MKITAECLSPELVKSILVDMKMGDAPEKDSDVDLLYKKLVECLLDENTVELLDEAIDRIFSRVPSCYGQHGSCYCQFKAIVLIGASVGVRLCNTLEANEELKKLHDLT